MPAPGLPGEYGESEAAVRTVGLDELPWMLRRHARLVLAVTAVAVAVAGVVAHVTGPVYRAVAAIRLSDPRRALTGGVVDDPARADERFADPLLSQVELLKSRTVAGLVVDDMPMLRLVTTRRLAPSLLGDVAVPAAAEPDTFHLAFGPDSFVARGRSGRRSATYGAAVEFDGIRFAILRRPDAARGRLQVLSREAAINRLRDKLRVKPRVRTDLVDVAYPAAVPHVAQQVVNRVIDVFQATSAADAQQQSRWRREFLEAQLAVNDSLLADARQELTDFLNRRERAYGSRESRERDLAGLAGLEVQRGQLEAERRTYQDLLTALRDSGASRKTLQTALAMPGLAATPAVTQLSTQLFEQEATRDSLASRSASHPDLPRLRQLIASTEASLIRAVQAGMQSAIASLSGRIDALNDVRVRRQQLSATEGEEDRLRERVENARKVVDALQIEYQHAKIAEAVTVGQVELVDRAGLPMEPAGIGLPEQLALGLLVGLLLGAGAAFLAERLGSVLARRVQVEQLGIPVLGVVTHLDHNGKAKGAKSADAVIEAFRGIRLSVANAHGAPRPIVVAVTSPQSGDGKSFVASNLALTFAHAEQRTLLVDADLRRGAIHRILNLQRQPGLMDLLIGSANRDQVVQPTCYPSLDFLASGARRSDAPELMGSSRMADLATTLRSSYDVIVLDTPPLGAGVDALGLATIAGNVVIVLRLGRTDRGLAEAKLEALRPLPIRLLGAVLNDVRDGSEYGAYGYYLDGYALTSEPLFRPLTARDKG